MVKIYARHQQAFNNPFFGGHDYFGHQIVAKVSYLKRESSVVNFLNFGFLLKQLAIHYLLN
jgi:hypothetical protein